MVKMVLSDMTASLLVIIRENYLELLSHQVELMLLPLFQDYTHTKVMEDTIMLKLLHKLKDYRSAMVKTVLLDMTVLLLEIIQESSLELHTHLVELIDLLLFLDFTHMNLMEGMITFKQLKMMLLRKELLELRKMILKLLLPNHFAVLLVLIPQPQVSLAEELELLQED